jgi:replication-associated recombination protein RarA
LNQSLRTHAGVYARRLLVIVVVEDMRCAETKQWATTVDAVEMVVCVCYAEVASVFGSILVGMTY